MDNTTESLPQTEPLAQLPKPTVTDSGLKRKRGSDEASALPVAKATQPESGPASRTRSKFQDSGVTDAAPTTIETVDQDTTPKKTGEGKRITKKSTPTPEELHVGKPEPSGQPEVWSDTRAALCNALDYFRCHHGGTHSKDNVAVGLLIDSKVGDEDLFSSEVVITAA